MIHSLLTLISSPLKELPKALPLGRNKKPAKSASARACFGVKMQFTCWTCPVRANQKRQQQQREEGEKKESSVRRSCNELVIYYAPSWRGLINGQRIGSDLTSMSALIGHVRSSTAFAKLMQIMRGQHKMMMQTMLMMSIRLMMGMWGERINAGLMSQVAQKGFCGCVCLDTSRANPWPDKLYELCRRPRMNHWPQAPRHRQTRHTLLMSS